MEFDIFWVIQYTGEGEGDRKAARKLGALTPQFVV